jgi:hypothetical protein
MRPAVRPLACLGLSALLLCPACKQSDSVADVLLVAEVDVSPPSASLNPQETLQLEATPKSSGGLVLPPREVTWSSSAPSLVEVSPTGLVRALGVGGPVAIRATIEGVEGEASINVTPIPVDHVTVSPSGPLSLLVGTSTQLTATAYDAAGAILAGRNFLWDSDAPSILPVTTGGMVIAQAVGGPVTITATTGGKSGSSTFSVAPRPATRLGFLQQPGLAIAGQPMAPAIRIAIQDDLLGTVTNATNSVSIALLANPGGAVLSGTTTVAAVNGVASFSDLRVDRAGTAYTFQVTSSGLTSATSTPFDVSAGAASKLGFSTAPPATARSGVTLSPAPGLQLRDAAGNPVAQAGILITATIASGPGSLGGTTSGVTSGAGAVTFSNLSLAGAIGSYSIEFGAPGMLPATSGPIALSAGLPTALTIEVQPSSAAQSGVVLPQQPKLQLRDQSGNAVAQAGISVTASIASGPPGGSNGGTPVVSTDGQGVASYTDLSVTGLPGNYTLGFAASGISGTTSNTITLGAGGGTVLAITTQPSSTVASGAVFPVQPVIQLRDAGGNPVPQSGVVVTAAIASGGGTLGGTLTATTNGNGTAGFSDLSITGAAGPRTLSFSAPSMAAVTSVTIDVTVTSTASQLSITTQPSGTAQSGVVFARQPVILVRDAANNPVSGVVVTVAIASGGGTLGGTLTATSDPSGVAAFTDLAISGLVGNRTLAFSAPGATTVTSKAIDLNPGPASQLIIATQPSSSALAGLSFLRQPVVRLADADGNFVNQSGIVVTAAINSATGNGTLGGTLNDATNSNGAASFSNLKISAAGSYTLIFSSGTLTPIVSAVIQVF